MNTIELAAKTAHEVNRAYCSGLGDHSHVADGWVYGIVKDPESKTHPCLVPYQDLPAEQRIKDSLFGLTVRGVLGLV